MLRELLKCFMALYGYDSLEMCGNYEGGKFTKKKVPV